VKVKGDTELMKEKSKNIQVSSALPGTFKGDGIDSSSWPLEVDNHADFIYDFLASRNARQYISVV
jgi:hypothetical protein